MADIELNAHNVVLVTTTVTEGGEGGFWRELTIESQDGSKFRLNLFGKKHESLSTKLVDCEGREVKP